MNRANNKILIVDDEARMCESLQELFSGGGYDASATQSSVEALQKIKSECFDVIVTDIKMPEASGLDILKAGKVVDPEMVIILMTGYASLESALDAIKHGAFEYHLKPVEFAQLEISVKRGLEIREANLARRKLLEDLKTANTNLNNRLEEINALYEAGKSLAYASNLNELLKKIVSLASGVTQAEIGSLMLINPTNEYLTIEAFIGLDPKIAGSVKLPIGSSIAGYVAKSAEPLVVRNVEKDRRFKRINRERYTSASLLCVPLKVNNRVLGVINLANKEQGQVFSKHDLKLATTFASQAAVAIDDARQFEDNLRKLREFSILFGLSRKLSTVGSVSAMRNAVFEYMKKLMPVDYALWFEWQPTQNNLKPVGVTGTSIPLTDSGSINLNAIKNEEIILADPGLREVNLDDINRFSKILSEKIKEYPVYPRPGVNFTALPVVQEGELKHVFCIGSNNNRPYDSQEISLARLIISQASGLYEREKALLNATRLLTMGNMISEISHDLRRPLTNIKGWIQILREKWPEVTKDADFFNMVEEEIHRLNDLVKELADFSRPHKYETEMRDIRMIIRRAADLIGPELRKKSIEFVESYDDCNFEIVMNRNQILEVFLNLFLNAIDAMSRGGTLRVSGKIGRPSFKKSDYLAIVVSDNGCGIKKENLSKIFDRYYTTKETGTGLGLAVVERIMTAHGGTLEVQSEYEGGTDFTLYFPI
jgi:signal transduction histidine kinase/FixJ family two-component response regulator